MRLIFAAIICIFASLPVASAYAREGMGMAGWPTDTGAIVTAKDDSSKTTTPPPTFRINNPAADKADPSTKPLGEKRVFRPLDKGRTVTCIFLSAGAGRYSGYGPGLIITRHIDKIFAFGFVADLEINSSELIKIPVCLHLREYFAPEKTLYYVFTDLGYEYYAKKIWNNDPSLAPICRLGLGILSKSGTPPELFFEGGYKAAFVPKGTYPRIARDFLGTVFFRGGLAF